MAAHGPTAAVPAQRGRVPENGIATALPGPHAALPVAGEPVAAHGARQKATSPPQAMPMAATMTQPTVKAM